MGEGGGPRAVAGRIVFNTFSGGHRVSEGTRPCEICRAPIEAERLEAVPETRLCAEHAREIAKYGGEFRATATAEGTGQKTGRGVVAVNKVRNAEAIEKVRAEYERGA
jgi:hypothetical protein